MHRIFYGAMIFAADIILLSASRTGLQAMVDLCHDFVSLRNLKFGTKKDPSKSKTKCIIYTKKVNTDDIAKIRLGDDFLSSVNEIQLLGLTLQVNIA